MRLFFFIFLSFIITACAENKTYQLLYPIEASKQNILRLEGYRFLSSTLRIPSSILVLSNPIENGGFAEFAFALTNKSTELIHLRPADFLVKLRDHGKLEVITAQTYAQAEAYTKPKGFEKLSPKMKAYGCAAANTEDNINVSSFDATQDWVWSKHQHYPFKQNDLYLKDIEIAAGETKGIIFRIKLPLMLKDFKQSTILVQIKGEGYETYKFKFILQSLE